jgi:hypothetical protein
MWSVFPDNSLKTRKEHMFIVKNIWQNLWHKDNDDARPLDLKAGRRGYHLQRPTVEVAMHESLKMNSRNQVLKSGDTKTFPSAWELHSKQALSQFLVTVVAARCPIQLTSSNTLMPASVPPSPSGNFNTVMVLSLGSGSGQSSPSRPLGFRISTRRSGMSSVSWEIKKYETGF